MIHVPGWAQLDDSPRLPCAQLGYPPVAAHVAVLHPDPVAHLHQLYLAVPEGKDYTPRLIPRARLGAAGGLAWAPAPPRSGGCLLLDGALHVHVPHSLLQRPDPGDGYRLGGPVEPPHRRPVVRARGAAPPGPTSRPPAVESPRETR